MGNAIKNMSIGTKIKWLITIVLPIILMIIPINDVYTVEIRGFLTATVFFICLAAFELIPVLLAGLMLPMLYVILKATTVSVAMSPWSSSFLMWAVIGGFIFAFALEESGLVTRFVYWAAIKCKGKYVPLLFTLLIVSYIVQFVTFTRAWMLIIILFYGVVEALNLKFTKQGLLLMIAAQMVCAATCVFMYAPTVGALYQSGIQMIIPEYTLHWLMQPYLGWLYIPISAIILLIFLKLYKVSNDTLSGGQEYFEQEYAKLGKMTKAEKWALVITILTVLYMATGDIHHLDGNYAFVFFPVLFFLPGINVASKESLKKVDMGSVVFIGSCMGIGAVGGAVGIGDMFSKYLAPLLEGCPIPVFLVGCLLLGIIMNILMTPGAMLALFSGPLTALGLGLGIVNPMVPAMAMYFANELVFMPYQNSYVLIMYGFGTMTMKDFVQYNVIKMILFIILFAVLIIPYWYVIGAI